MEEYTREIQWVTKSNHPLYPKEHPPFRVYIDEYIEVKQEESMSGAYPEATYLSEYELVDYQGSIIIPWLAGETFAGFKFFPTKKWATNHIKEHYHLFPKVIEQHPELLI
jgi:hypothetical protein